MTQLHEPSVAQKIDYAALLRRAFTHPEDHEALELLKQCTKEGWEELANVTLDAPQVARAIEENPVWAGKVFAALAHGTGVSDMDVRSAREAIGEAESADFLVGQAFSQCLLSDLPDHLRNWNARFGALPRIKRSHQEALAATPSVQGAEMSAFNPEGELLARGLTPISFLEASNSVWLATSNLRYSEPDRFGKGLILTGFKGLKWANSDADCADVLTREIQSTAEVSESAAQLLLRWLVAVAWYKPCIFRQYAADVIQGDLERAVILRPDDQTRDWPLAQLWSQATRPPEDRRRNPALDQGLRG